MRQTLPINVRGNPSNTTTQYMSVFSSRGTSSGWNSTEANINDVFEVAGAISQLTVWIEARDGWKGGSATFTLRVNGADTGLTVTMNVGDKIQIDKTHSISIAKGDKVTLKCAPGASMTASQRPSITAIFTGTTSGQSVYGGGSTASLNNAGTRQWSSLCTGGAWGTTQATAAQTVVSVPGTLKAFRFDLVTAPGAGTTREVSVYLNGTQVAATVGSISGSTTSFEVTGLTQALAVGDLLQVSHKSTAGTPAASAGQSWSVQIDPTTDGEFMLCGHTNNSGSAGTTSFNPFGISNSGWTSGSQGELNMKLVMPLACTLSKLYCAAPYAAPGGTETQTETLRINGVGSTITAAITGASKSANDTTHSETLDALDTISWKHVRSASAVDSNIAWSLKCVIAADPTVITGRTPQVIPNGSVSVVAFNDTGYLPVMGSNGVSNAQDSYDNVKQRIPPGYVGKMKTLRVLTDVAVTTGSFKATLVLNGVDTALTCTVTSSGTTNSDLTHEIAIIGGDLVAMKFETSGGASNIAPKGYSVTAISDTDGEILMMGSSADSSIAYGTRVYWRPNSPATANTTIGNCQDVVPLYCKIKAWRVDIDPASASDVNTFTIYKNTAQIAATAIAIAAGQTTGNVTGLSLQLYPGDLIALSGISDTFDTVDSHNFKYSMLLVADTCGESWFGGGSSDDLDTTGATEYAQPQVGNVVWRTQERPVLVGMACTLRDMRILVTGTTGAGYGKSWTFITRKNGSDASESVKMEDESFMNDDPDTTDSLAAGDYFILKETNTGTPTAQDATWAWVVYVKPILYKTLTETHTITATIIRKAKKVLSDAHTLVASIIKKAGKLIANSVTLTATITMFVPKLKVLTDTLTLTATAIKKGIKVVSDGVSLTIVLTKTPMKMLVETITITELFVRVATLYRTLTDSLAVLDVLIRKPQKIFANSASLTEAFNHVGVFIRTYADTLTIVESVMKLGHKLLAESVNVSETFVRGMIKRFAENSTIVEAFNTFRPLIKLLTDTLTIADAFVRGPVKLLSNSVSIVETFSRQPVKLLVDALSLTASLVKKAVRFLVETLSITEAYSRVVAFGRMLTESINIIANAVKAWSRTMDDVLSLNDVLLRLPRKILASTITISETFGRAMNKVFHDTALLVIDFSKLTARMLVESITIVIDFFGDKTNKNVVKLFTESMELREKLVRHVTKNFIEQIVLVFQFIKDFRRTFADSMTLAATIIKKAIISRLEAISVSDVYSRVWQAIRSFTVIVGLTERFQKGYRTMKTDSMTLTATLVKKPIKSILNVITITSTFIRGTWVTHRVLLENVVVTGRLYKLLHRTITSAITITDALNFGYVRVIANIITLVDAGVTRGIRKIITANIAIREKARVWWNGHLTGFWRRIARDQHSNDWKRRSREL